MGNPLPISNEPLWEIVEQAAFLEERLGGGFLPETRAEDSEDIEPRIAAWRKNCTKGDAEVFRKRFHGMGSMRFAPGGWWGESGNQIR